ncbi:type IA DNA topoisomerase [Aureivirga sp. CE67]|uniref:type IA DNA topoisomerase n=1 Tax=Aureivirga sp. CE67 TaxID=1788983 RepID=UPI0018CA7681|nr:type IA DNA topoisomerase [Aureivirga sp. CE67]
MKVCIAEKPSVAKEIATILGANTRRDGYFEGNGYCVTWTFGHLCTLFMPDNYKPHWKFWNLNTLPMLPEKFEIKVIEDSGVEKQFQIVKSLFQKAEVVINCGDAGQEGELIQRWVIKHADYHGKVQRLWISSLTPEAIKEGFQNLKDAEEYDNLYYAGMSRAIGDWLLGMNATRLYTLIYGRDKKVLSVGRVQTPTLAMLVERFKEIQNFVPKPYWELQTTYRNTIFNCEEGKFEKKEEGEKFLEKVKDAPFEVTSVTKKKGKEHPQKLFDLTGLQVYCNTKFGFSADKTLKIAQKLYEQKLITYPRVDTTFLPNDIYPKSSGILSKLSKYANFTEKVLGTKLRKSTKVFNDKKVTDHHAIIPTGFEMELGWDEQRVYDIVTRRFIAVFYPDCIFSTTTVLGKVTSVSFKTTGKEILEKGWREVIFLPKKETEENKDSKKKTEEVIMPTFEKGESGPHKPDFVEKKTTAPKNYTEATLLRAMETAGKKVEDEELKELMKANGIGRPSTRANIIETLFKRNYITRNKKNILPTSMGVQLIDTIENQLLKSAELTGQWEKKLKEIEQGDHNASVFIRNMKGMVSNLVDEVRILQSKSKGITEQPILQKPKPKKEEKPEICPKCKKGKVLKGKENYGCSEWKNGCDFRVPFVFFGKKISDTQFKKLLKTGKTQVLKGFVLNDEKFDGIVTLDENGLLNIEKA